MKYLTKKVLRTWLSLVFDFSFQNFRGRPPGRPRGRSTSLPKVSFPPKGPPRNAIEKRTAENLFGAATNFVSVDQPPLDQGNGDSFPCHLCSAVFKMRQLLDKHLKSHEKGTARVPRSTPGEFSCGVCGQTFSFQVFLQSNNT